MCQQHGTRRREHHFIVQFATIRQISVQKPRCDSDQRKANSSETTVDCAGCRVFASRREAESGKVSTPCCDKVVEMVVRSRGGPRAALLTLASWAALGAAAARQVCMTCYADSTLGRCTIPEGYGVNCLYVSVVAGNPKQCWKWASDVYGDWDLKGFAAANKLTVIGMVNTDASGPTDVVETLEQCRDTINQAQPSSTWPALDAVLNVDWEPCDGSARWPAARFRLDYGGSVAGCAATLPAHGELVEMVYDGAQQGYLSGAKHFNCSRRYMFTAELSKVAAQQTSSVGGITPGLFVQQCGLAADYDVYVPRSLYGHPELAADCARGGVSCVPVSSTDSPSKKPSTPAPTKKPSTVAPTRRPNRKPTKRPHRRALQPLVKVRLT